MPLSLGTSRLITRSSRQHQASTNGPQNNIVNINNITQTSHSLRLSDQGDSEILIDTPDEQYFKSSTWILNIDLPPQDRYCKTILIGLTQESRQWTPGTTITINFLSKTKIVATTLITPPAAQFYKFIIASTASSKLTIHKHVLEPLTMVA